MDEHEDDEINIDFSKIKKLFSGKKRERPIHKDVPSQENPTGPVQAEKTKTTSQQAGEEKSQEQIPEHPDEHTIAHHTEHTSYQQEKSTRRESDQPHKESEDDDEIKINFSKIKKVFSPAEPKKETEESEEDREEEISFDFKKITSAVKGAFSKEESSEDDLGVDTKKIKRFVLNHKTMLLTLILILIPLITSVHLRSTPADLPITEQWARDSVNSQIRSQIQQQINQQYPNLPQSNKNNLISAEFEKFQKEQGGAIEQQIMATANFFKSQLQDDSGQTYLLAIDPYFWMRHAQNVLDNGHPGDELRINSKGKDAPYDTYMFGPVGRFVPGDDFHAYFEALLFKVMHAVDKDTNLMKAAFYTPVILASLSVIPIFFIGRRISGNLGGFIAALIVAIHPAFLTRTAGGFADTDAYNVLFPLIIAWFFLEAFETKDIKKIIMYTLGAGFFVGLFSATWGGWWYIMNFIIITSIAYIGYYVILHREKLKNPKAFIQEKAFLETPISLGFFLIFSCISTSLFSSFNVFMDGFLIGPRSFVTLKQVGISSVWPNVFTTVAEQNTASLNNVINQIGMGNQLFFLIALTGLAWSLLARKENTKREMWLASGSLIWYILLLAMRPQKTMFIILTGVPIAIWLFDSMRRKQTGIDIKASLLLTLWFASTIYASTKGVRFTLVAVPAFALAVGVTANVIYRKASNLLSDGLHLNKHLVNAMVIGFLLLLLFGKPLQAASQIAVQEIPSMNDAWYDSLEQIDRQADENAIINSWWDFGHWFKMIGNRPVTFDGTSQNTPNAHWIGSVLLTDNENYARGVLRMLDCGQNKAFDEISKEIADVPRAVALVKEIILFKEPEEAKKRLQLSGIQNADEVIKYSHCTPPENYFITSHDMVGKGGVWAHFGTWNFERALMYNTLKKKEYQNNRETSIGFLRERFNMTEKQAEDIYFEVQSIDSDTQANAWIAPWPSYQGQSSCSENDEGIIECELQQGVRIQIDKATLETPGINTPQGTKFPDSISLARDRGVIEKLMYNKDKLGIAISLYPTSDRSYRALITHPRLADAMFTRLFYMNGHGSNYFEKFSDRSSFTGGRIIVWKVDWEGNAFNEVPYFTELRQQNFNATASNATASNATASNATIPKSA